MHRPGWEPVALAQRSGRCHGSRRSGLVSAASAAGVGVILVEWSPSARRRSPPARDVGYLERRYQYCYYTLLQRTSFQRFLIAHL